MALRFIATVIGEAVNNQTGTTQLTFQCNPGTFPSSQLILNGLLPIDLSSLSIGQNVQFIIALNAGEQTAIAGAVTVNPMSTQD